MQWNTSEEAHVLILERGESVLESVTAFLKQQNISAAEVSGIGAVSDAAISYFDTETQKYIQQQVQESCEVLSLLGNVSMKEGNPFPHMHIVLGLPDCTVRGGHFHDATVSVTLELVIRPIAMALQRSHNPDIGLWLLKGAEAT